MFVDRRNVWAWQLSVRAPDAKLCHVVGSLTCCFLSLPWHTLLLNLPSLYSTLQPPFPVPTSRLTLRCCPQLFLVVFLFAANWCWSGRRRIVAATPYLFCFVCSFGGPSTSSSHSLDDGQPRTLTANHARSSFHGTWAHCSHWAAAPDIQRAINARPSFCMRPGEGCLQQEQDPA